MIMCNLFKRFFKKKDKSPAPVTPSHAVNEKAPVEEMTFALIRVLADNLIPNAATNPADKLSIVRVKSLELAIHALQSEIGTKPVVIYYTNAARIGINQTVEKVKELLTEHHISVLSTHKADDLSSGNSRYMSNTMLQKLAAPLYNGEYIIFLTHGLNIDIYMHCEHSEKAYMQLGEGQGVTSEGKSI